MSNELIVGMIAAVGLAAVAILIARFMLLDDPITGVLHRVGQVVRQADPDLPARLSLQELQRPAASVRRAGHEGVSR